MTRFFAEKSSAHVFVDDLDTLELAEDDAHHLSRVLRIGPDEVVTASDGQGGWRPCRLVAGALVAVGDAAREPRPAPPLMVAFALTKGEKPEWAVQKLTEVGVDRIVPFVAARSVVRWDETKAGRHHERWRRVAREAAMQSRRVWLPEVTEVADFAALVAGVGTNGALACPGGASPTVRRAAVLVGPEGGWAPQELACGLPTVGLGPTILRAETAAVAAGVMLVGLREGLVTEP